MYAAPLGHWEYEMPQPVYSRDAVQQAFRLCVSELRGKRGIAQEKLAANAGIDRAYMSRLERGQNSPTLYMLVRLCAGLDLSFEEFAAEFARSLRRARRNAPPQD